MYRMDLLGPVVVLVREMLERFQMQHDFAQLRPGAEAVVEKVRWQMKAA